MAASAAAANRRSTSEAAPSASPAPSPAAASSAATTASCARAGRRSTPAAKKRRTPEKEDLGQLALLRVLDPLDDRLGRRLLLGRRGVGAAVARGLLGGGLLALLGDELVLLLARGELLGLYVGRLGLVARCRLLDGRVISRGRVHEWLDEDAGRA